MSSKKFYIGLISLVLLFSTNLYASHGGQYKKVDGMAVYLVIVPAEMLQGHPKGHPESSMHLKQRVDGKFQHHIMVSLFDVKTGARLQGAIVNAKVLGEDFVGPTRRLELMIMGNTQNYGNYFNVPDQGAYRVVLEIRFHEKDKVTKVEFQYADT